MIIRRGKLPPRYHLKEVQPVRTASVDDFVDDGIDNETMIFRDHRKVPYLDVGGGVCVLHSADSVNIEC